MDNIPNGNFNVNGRPPVGQNPTGNVYGGNVNAPIYGNAYDSGVGQQPYTGQPTGQTPSYTVPSTQSYYQGNPQVQQGSQQGGTYNQSPVNVYNAQSCQTGVPQYHYGYGTTPFVNEAYYREQQARIAKHRAAERKMSKVGNASGLILIGSVIVSFIFSTVYVSPAISSIIDGSLSATSLFNIFYSIVCVGLSFAVLAKLYNTIKTPAYPGVPLTEEQSPDFKTSFNPPKDWFKTMLLMVICFGGCMLANYLSSIILAFFEMVGVHSTYSSVEDPKNAADTVMMFLSIAVIPPLIEELALRGIVLSKLRKYGNAFAIIASAFMFGIFHGTAAQIPFAFMCGLFFGYLTIATNSIWPAIFVHAFNNSLSCITSVLLQVTDEATANMFYYVLSVGGIVLAIFALFLYIKNYGKDNKVLTFKGEAAVLTTGQKMKKFIFNPAMIVSILIYAVMALMTLEI